MSARRCEAWSHVLINAERALAVSSLGELVALLPDEHAVAEVLNEHLAQGSAVLVPEKGRWRLRYESSSVSAQAAFTLAKLVILDDGFARVKQCARCRRPFVDQTSARTGKRCAEHLRSPGENRRYP
ncbi:hypothetical protein [Streptosporangium sp. NPDC020145]|uniref:hypothetical protein n=1 Tax=Streptosporangium sp. NPDC020145 TaxID=3154694 RepID=UPI0034276B40